MKALMALCYLSEGERLERNLTWLEYYRKIKSELGYDIIILIDNGSKLEDLEKLGGTVLTPEGDTIIGSGDSDLIVYHFDEFLPRVSVHQYPYLWRGVQLMQKLIIALGIDKVYFIDTDVYVLKSRFANYLKELSTGWSAMWCDKYGFPETSLHILCQDSLHKFVDFPIPSWTHHDGTPMETLMPFTNVVKNQFIGDRYGETCSPQLFQMDYYAQHNVSNCPKMMFNMEEVFDATKE